MRVQKPYNRDDTCCRDATGDIAVEKDALDTHRIGVVFCEQLPDDFVVRIKPFAKHGAGRGVNYVRPIRAVGPAMAASLRSHNRYCQCPDRYPMRYYS